MRQGTISVLFGCHSIVHSILVVLAWKKLYGGWPQPWQVICVFLHDIGHWGTDYLDNQDEKKRHWVLGADVAGNLFGIDAYYFTAGHCAHSECPESMLYKADKYSYYIAPTWWLWWNSIVEPRLNSGARIKVAILKFRAQVKESIESGEYRESHEMFLDRKEVVKHESGTGANRH